MSRSGRIRKKSSKFADFESPDEIDGLSYKKRNSPSKSPQKPQPPKVQVPQIEESSNSDESDSDETDSDIDVKDDSMGFEDDWGESVDAIDILDDYKDDYDDENGSLQVDETRSASKDDNYSQANSLYFSEKKKPAKDSGQIKKKKNQRKDKGKARLTAYMLWARATRPKIVEDNPMMDFSAVNKRLGEMWNHIPYTQKCNWKRKAKKIQSREKKPERQTMISTGKAKKSPTIKSKPASKGKLPTEYGRGGNKSQTKSAPLAQISSPGSTKQTYQTPKLANSSTASHVMADTSPPSSFKVTGTSPIDVAAHLKLLGESLNNIGQKLKEHEGQIAVSGSLSVLLDSMLCVLGPLACLSNQLEETQGSIPEQTLSNILDNIAYIMPGIV